MAHEAQRIFFESIKKNNPEYFNNVSVIEIGSLNINGTVRDFFNSNNYVGVDLEKGNGVDLVCEGQNVNLPSNYFDVSVSAECFEHNPYWKETFLNMYRMSSKFVIFTCASDGRPEHGTSKTSPRDSPFTIKWDYYKNLNEKDFRDNFDLDNMFDKYEFSYNESAKDLYFWGLKKDLEIHHFYHIYSDGNWYKPTFDHIKSLKESQLYYNLKNFKVGIVGREFTRKRVKQYLDSQNINYSICTERKEGWEQETLDELYEFSKKNNGCVFYAHTKNAVNTTDLHVKWRIAMTHYNINKWKDNISLLHSGYQAVGCHYLNSGNVLVSTPSGFFAGNFWWTHLKYIREFPNPPLRISRYDAEGWIGNLKPLIDENKEHFKIYDYCPWHPGEMEYEYIEYNKI